jgi:hypothetical protein
VRGSDGAADVVVVVEDDVAVSRQVGSGVSGAPEVVHELDVKALVLGYVQRVFGVADYGKGFRVVGLRQSILLFLRHAARVSGSLGLVDDFDDADGGFVGGCGMDASGHPVEPCVGAVIVALREETWKPLLAKTLL